MLRFDGTKRIADTNDPDTGVELILTDTFLTGPGLSANSKNMPLFSIYKKTSSHIPVIVSFMKQQLLFPQLHYIVILGKYL